VFTLVFACCLCHVGTQLKKHSQFQIRPNSAPAGFEKKIISSATLVGAYISKCLKCRHRLSNHVS